MAELTRSAREALASSPGSDALFDADSPGIGLVTVSSAGLYNENLSVAGMRVGEIRSRFRDRLDIDPHATAEINGRPVHDSEVVSAGQLLLFVRHSGEKGTGMATVSAGLFNEDLPVANMTVGEIRTRLGDRLNIDAHSRAEIDGRPVNDGEVVRAGQLLLFVRQSAEKH